MRPDLSWPDFQTLHSGGQLQEILASLDESGLYFKPAFIDPAITNAWQQYAENQSKADRFHQASIGLDESKMKDASIRSDSILWVHEFSGVTAPIGHWLKQLMAELKNHFRVSLETIESHFSIYSKGAHYAKHIDNGIGQNSRFFTFIFYLNPAWMAGDGGELVVYDPKQSQRPIHTIAPKSGTFVIFRSDLFYHEVLASRVPRYTFTGWLRRYEGL